MEKTIKFVDISINYVTLFFIISTNMMVSAGSVLVLYHIDMIKYDQMINLYFYQFSIIHYMLIYLGLSLLFKGVVMVTEHIKKHKEKKKEKTETLRKKIHSELISGGKI